MVPKQASSGTQITPKGKVMFLKPGSLSCRWKDAEKRCKDCKGRCENRGSIDLISKSRLGCKRTREKKAFGCKISIEMATQRISKPVTFQGMRARTSLKPSQAVKVRVSIYEYMSFTVMILLLDCIDCFADSSIAIYSRQQAKHASPHLQISKNSATLLKPQCVKISQ